MTTQATPVKERPIIFSGRVSDPVLHICSPKLVSRGKRRVVRYPWFIGEEPGEEEQPTCECGAFIRPISRTFEFRTYEGGWYDGWYIAGVHYQCKRCGRESSPDLAPQAGGTS